MLGSVDVCVVSLDAAHMVGAVVYEGNHGVVMVQLWDSYVPRCDRRELVV